MFRLCSEQNYNSKAYLKLKCSFRSLMGGYFPRLWSFKSKIPSGNTIKKTAEASYYLKIKFPYRTKKIISPTTYIQNALGRGLLTSTKKTQYLSHVTLSWSLLSQNKPKNYRREFK